MEPNIEYAIAMLYLHQEIIDNNKEKLSSQEYLLLCNHNQYILSVLEKSVSVLEKSVLEKTEILRVLERMVFQPIGED